ncbi:dihydroxy-acid dehydratase, partial [Phaeovulum sp.]|uniref:dihydroxy-acid dehydratase domain-containing protein n=1 Tax=Phaeovulum sp. TaxID=2934796 RepID=UPI003564600E
RATEITALGADYRPAGEMLDERSFVNALVGLMATGGSTNLVLHLPAMARAAGILLDLEDFDAVSSAVPLLAKVYPNGLADVNHFHAAGGLGFLIGQLLDAGLLHPDVRTVAGDGLALYRREPKLIDGTLAWHDGPEASLNEKILRPAPRPFAPSGGLQQLHGNLGRGVIKVSSVPADRLVIEAPARVFASQDAVKEAFKRNEFTSDVVVVVRFQGPRANGMPELHALTPVLSVLQDRGLRVALVTDGRMSGASGKVPAAIHVCPEATGGGPLARLADGDIVRLDASAGKLDCLTPNFETRPPVVPDLSANASGVGREMFELFRRSVGAADAGASSVL